MSLEFSMFSTNPYDIDIDFSYGHQYNPYCDGIGF